MKSRKKSKFSRNKWKRTHKNPKPTGHSEGTPEKEVHSNTGLLKNDRKFSNKWPDPTSTNTRETTTNETQREDKEENNENQSRIIWHRY